MIGLWGASTASTGTKLAESVYSLAGIALGLLGLGWMWRKGVESAVPLVLVATIFLFVAGGLADVTVARQLAGAERVLRVDRPPPGERHPRARRRARAGGGASGSGLLAAPAARARPDGSAVTS